jgi:hypothetical protein
MYLTDDFCYIYRFNLYFEGPRRDRVTWVTRGDDNKEPKRRQMRRLAHRYVILLLQPCFMETNKYLLYFTTSTISRPPATTNESSRLVGGLPPPHHLSTNHHHFWHLHPTSKDHQRVIATRWWVFSSFATSAASTDHQRVLATRWWFPRLPSAHHHLPPLQPLLTTNESSRLVGGSLGFHLPSTTTNDSSRLVGGTSSSFQHLYSDTFIYYNRYLHRDTLYILIVFLHSFCLWVFVWTFWVYEPFATIFFILIWTECNYFLVIYCWKCIWLVVA